MTAQTNEPNAVQALIDSFNRIGISSNELANNLNQFVDPIRKLLPEMERNQLDVLNAFGFADMDDFRRFSKANPEEGWETLQQMEDAWESASQ